MSLFSQGLLKIRTGLGFKSGLSFYNFLEERGAVGINYPHYKKIEMGKTIAQPDFVRRLVSIFPEHAETLIRAFCADQFPEFSNLFSVNVTEAAPLNADKENNLFLYSRQELTVRQVSIIATSELHYAFYLLITLARRPVTFVEIQRAIQDINLEVIKDFDEAKLIFQEGDSYRSRSFERVFPKAETVELKRLFLQFDRWDLTVHEKLQMEKVIKKSIFRRVSPRYVPILIKQAEVLIDQLRTSDDSDTTKNTEVLSLMLSIRQAKLPG